MTHESKEEMDTTNEASGDEIRALFSKELNRHGYGFQYAVLKKCEEIAAILRKEIGGIDLGASG